jgi:hypothetical protein
MSARKAGNGFVAGENCFVAGGPTKQCVKNLNDFRRKRQKEPDLGGGLATARRQPGIESPPLTSVVHGPVALVDWLTAAVRSGDFLTFLWWRSGSGCSTVVNRSVPAADLS